MIRRAQFPARTIAVPPESYYYDFNKEGIIEKVNVRPSPEKAKKNKLSSLLEAGVTPQKFVPRCSDIIETTMAIESEVGSVMEMIDASKIQVQTKTAQQAQESMTSEIPKDKE